MHFKLRTAPCSLPHALSLIFILLSVRVISQDRLVPPGYHTYDEIIALADSLAEHYPAICKKVAYGTSLGGRDLVALKISDSVDAGSTEPEILFDGGCHGDEVGGPENLIRFARDLCMGYGADPLITDLVDSREIWLYLMVNPDGRVNMSRFNNAMVDVNRDYGYMWDASGGSTDAFSQPETRGVRDCMSAHRFVMYVSYHSGMEQAAYPWAYRESAAPDKPNFRRIAKTYADSSLYASLLYGQSFTIMYQVNGMSIDYFYGTTGQACFTLELSVDKQPPDPLTCYLINYPAMIEMLRMAGWGVQGRVTDSLTGEPLDAAIWVDDFFPVYTDTVLGDFHKILVPGYHALKVTANGYKTRTDIPFHVPQQGTAFINIRLSPDSGWFAHRVTACRIPGDNPYDEANTPAALLAPDDTAYSIGRNGWIILDMGDTIMTGDGDDIRVYEAGIPDERFQVFGSGHPDGSWTLIGNGTGTTAFDLGIMPGIRYLKIVDDGDGQAQEADAGYDLDAVASLHSQGPWLSAGVPSPLQPLRIYPNPSHDRVNIEGNEISGHILELTDLTGRTILRKTITANPFLLDLTPLDAGLYRCTIRTGPALYSGLIIKLN